MLTVTKNHSTPKPASRENPPSKTVLWEIFADSTYSTTFFANETQCSCRENHTFAYAPAPGVHYYGYRYYSPQLGRWITRDPIGEDGGVNLYVVARNNTIIGFDILGLEFHICGFDICWGPIPGDDDDGFIDYPPDPPPEPKPPRPQPKIPPLPSKRKLCEGILSTLIPKALNALSPPTCCSMAASQGVISQQLAEQWTNDCLDEKPGSCKLLHKTYIGFFVCPDSESKDGTIGIFLCIPLGGNL